MSSDENASSGLSFPAQIFFGAVVLLVVVFLLRWAVRALLGTLQFVLIVVAIVAAGFWAVSAKANR